MKDHAELIGQLIHLGAKAVDRGLVLGSGGNLSARLPGGGACVVTASGTWLDELSPEDFSLVALDGTHRGGHPTPPARWPCTSTATGPGPTSTP